MTVEELEARILEGTKGLSTICMPKELAAFKAAAEAQGYAKGVAEGAEKESRRWLGAIELAVKEGTLGGFVSDALDNASLLAPTEQEKITRLAEIVADMSAEESPVEIITRAGSVAPDKGGEK